MTPSPVASMDIAAARALPDDTPVVVDGVLTLDLGSIDGARGGFVQDLTAGIGLYLTADPPALAPLGAHVRITGVLDTRYAQRVIRVAPDAVEGLGAADVPVAQDIETGAAGEPLEGSRVTVEGVVADPPSALADGLAVTVDDGSGSVRVIVLAAAGAPEIGTGDVVHATVRSASVTARARAPPAIASTSRGRKTSS